MENVYYMSKEVFVLKTKQQILVYNTFIEEIKAVMPIVQKFDQKVLTKRLITAIEKVANKVRFSLVGASLRLTIQGELRYVKGGGYIEYDSHDIDLNVNKLGWKLNSAESCEAMQNTIDYLSKCIKEYQSCIDNYDENVNKRFEIEKMIEEYQKSVPYYMRTHFDSYGTKYYIDKIK